jgi:hypothetical protein
MTIQTITARGLLAAASVVLLLAGGCGGDDDGGPTAGDDPTDPADVAGSWAMSRQIAPNACGVPAGALDTETILFEGAGDQLTVVTFDGAWGTCEVQGQTVTITGTDEETIDGCAATLATTGTAQVVGDEITGTLTTTITYDPADCPGRPPCTFTSDIALTALPDSPCLDRAVFPDPATSPYVLPYPVGAEYPVYQSYCWPCGGHRDQLAYDFVIPIGDPIVAARDGTVRHVRDSAPDDGQGQGEHNCVYIEHADGSVAFYAHLMQHSVMVAVDEVVTAGQQIARSGNSGASDEPHLHVGVYAGWPVSEGVDLPVSFRNADGPLDERGGLIRWEVYPAVAAGSPRAGGR